MAVNGGHAGTKKGPNWGHVKERKDREAPTPTLSALLRKRPVLLRTDFVLAKDPKMPYKGQYCVEQTGKGCTCVKMEPFVLLAFFPVFYSMNGDRTSLLHQKSPCRKRSPAKGVWQKSDEKSDRSIRKSDRKVTESVPKTKKSDRTPFAALLLRHPEKISSFCTFLLWSKCLWSVPIADVVH